MAEAFAYMKVHPLSGKQYFYPICVYNKEIYYLESKAIPYDYEETIRYVLALLEIASSG